MTGTDLAREVRTRWPAVPALIISGFAETEGIAPDLPRLTKPFRQSDLAEALTSLLSPAVVPANGDSIPGPTWADSQIRD